MFMYSHSVVYHDKMISQSVDSCNAEYYGYYSDTPKNDVSVYGTKTYKT